MSVDPAVFRPMTPEEIGQYLVAAREKISTPDRWTKGAFCRDFDGNALSYGHSKAVCWSLYGAIEAPRPREVYDVIYKANGIEQHVIDWNDAPERIHADVLEAIDKAISTLRGGEQITKDWRHR